jgi:high-affinity Fe2+/Pb2+ permease
MNLVLIIIGSTVAAVIGWGVVKLARDLEGPAFFGTLTFLALVTILGIFTGVHTHNHVEVITGIITLVYGIVFVVARDIYN